MNHEFDALVWIKDANRHELTPVTVSYELDGYKPIGLWVYDDAGEDRTTEIAEAEYDRLYTDACAKTAEDMACAAETYFEGDR